MAEVGIETIYEKAAKLLGIDIAVLQSRLFANFARLFYSSQNLQNNAKLP